MIPFARADDTTSSSNGTSSASESSTSSSSSTSQTTSSSDPVSSSSSPPILSSQRVIIERKVMLEKTDSGSSVILDDDDDDGPPIITSQESVKRYRNSPFGLTRHYLSMPDNGEPQSAKIFDNHQDVCDLSVSPNSSNASLAQPWQNYNQHHHHRHHHHRHYKPHSASQAKQIDQIDHLVDHQKQFGARHNPLILAPAGDAGLDAKKCNAKEVDGNADCYFADDANNLDLHNQQQKLKLGELSTTPESGGLLIRFSSIMYATFLVILGCILHVSELRQKSKNSTDHIYTIIVALLGIIWLLFLQTDLQRYKKYASKYILIETIFNDHRQKRRELARSNHDPTARSTTSSSASLVNDRMSMNTEVIFKKTAYKMYQQRAALDRQNVHKSHRNRNASKPLHSPSHNIEPFDVYKPARGASSTKESLSPTGTVDDTVSNHREQLVPAYKFLHGKMGANFYLKCGMAAFCFGHVIHEGLRFGQQLYFFGTGNVHCRDSAALIAHLITPLYSFYQLFMMFKYSNLVINRHKVLARFGLMHIVGTSVTFWFRTILEEAFEDFVHKMDYFKTNKPQLNLALTKQFDTDSNLVSLFSSVSNAIKTEASERSEWSIANPDQNVTMAQSLISLMSSPISATISPQLARHLPDSYACAQNTLLTTKSMNALPYLYPFTIEYNLLLAATFLSLYFNIGKIGITGNGESACRPFIFNHQSNYSNMMVPKSRSISSIPGSHVELSDNSSTAIRMREGSEKELGEYKSNFVVNADCHSANKGLFCGFFVLLVTLVTIVIFFVTINKPTHIQLGIKINLIQEATLTLLILIVTLAGFKQIMKLNRNPFLKDKVTTDDVLMLIPLPFFFIHSLLSFRAETASISSSGLSYFSSKSSQVNHHPHDSLTASPGNLQSILLSSNNNSNNSQIESRSRLNNLLAGLQNGTNGRFVEEFISNSNSNRNGSRIISSNIESGSSISSQIDHFKLITVALNIIVMIEVLVQTNFIIDGMRRCSESRYLRFKKPGRELITFAILLNITYWIVATFETKSVEQYKTEIEYYGPLPYMFISHTTLPVMLFYRYHSSVCLAEIWNRAYKPPKKR